MFEFMSHMILSEIPKKPLGLDENAFIPTSIEAISIAENVLRMRLPEQLRAFHLRVGSGRLLKEGRQGFM